MHCSNKTLCVHQQGFSLIEMLLATVILLVGLVAVAQLVPASLLMNYSNRMDSSALVFAQRELDQMLDQPLTSNAFLDSLGNFCQLGTPATPNVVQGNAVTVSLDNRAIINFAPAPAAGYGFLYTDPTDPNGATYDVRWAVIITGNGTIESSRRFLLGVRQVGGRGFISPVTLDTMVTR